MKDGIKKCDAARPNGCAAVDYKAVWEIPCGVLRNSPEELFAVFYESLQQHFPRQIVYFTFPYNSIPVNGVFSDFD